MKKISIFSPCYNEELNLETLYTRITDVMEKLEDKYDFKTLRKRKINLVYKFIFVYIVFLFALAITQMKLGYSDTVAFIIFAIFFFLIVGYFAREGYKIENIRFFVKFG